jgi:hypothetical protein
MGDQGGFDSTTGCGYSGQQVQGGFDSSTGGAGYGGQQGGFDSSTGDQGQFGIQGGAGYNDVGSGAGMGGNDTYDGNAPSTRDEYNQGASPRMVMATFEHALMSAQALRLASSAAALAPATPATTKLALAWARAPAPISRAREDRLKGAPRLPLVCHTRC